MSSVLTRDLRTHHVDVLNEDFDWRTPIDLDLVNIVKESPNVVSTVHEIL